MRDIVRARGEKQDPAACGQGRSEARKLAIATQGGRHLFTRFRERRRVSDDDVETLAGVAEPRHFAEYIGPAKAAVAVDLIHRRRLGGEGERRLGTVDPEHFRGAGARRLHRKPAGEAVKIEDAGITRQAGDKAAVDALIEKPAGLLPGHRVDRKYRAVLAHHDRFVDRAERHPRLRH